MQEAISSIHQGTGCVFFMVKWLKVTGEGSIQSSRQGMLYVLISLEA